MFCPSPLRPDRAGIVAKRTDSTSERMQLIDFLLPWTAVGRSAGCPPRRLDAKNARVFLTVVPRLRACFENGWRGRLAATRPPRSATRRPELPRATSRKDGPHWLEQSLPFRPASRRAEQAGRLCYQQTIFKTRS